MAQSKFDNLPCGPRCLYDKEVYLLLHDHGQVTFERWESTRSKHLFPFSTLQLLIRIPVALRLLSTLVYELFSLVEVLSLVERTSH